MNHTDLTLRPLIGSDKSSFRNAVEEFARTEVYAFADNPRTQQSKKLSGLERYRLGQGNCRILYSIEDDRLIICVVKVGDRQDVYR